MTPLTMTERTAVLKKWSMHYLYIFVVLFAVFCFLIKGIPGAAYIIFVFLLGSAVNYAVRFHRKMQELGMKE